ncbi:MAG: nucleotide exchange factor GrpE [Ignavibacteriales bacterium]|nr:nucleotide exchange factor GrpE [Ignavibacteriales bacterium]
MKASPSSIKDRLDSLNPVTADGMDLVPDVAEEFLALYVKLAKEQFKTNLTANSLKEEVEKHIEEVTDLMADLRRENAKLLGEQARLLSFVMDSADLIGAFSDSAKATHNEELMSMSLTLTSASSVLMQKLGIVEIPSEGEEPDSQYHYVLSHKEVDDHSKKGLVVEVVRGGFTWNGSVVRKADVVVGK